MDDERRRDDGMTQRRKVLGDAWVDKSIANRNSFNADFREREPQVTANMKSMLLATPVQGYLACCEALSTLDNRALLPRIKSPTLVIAGRHDMATPVAAGEFIRSQIPGASLTILDAAHISNVEQSHAFTDAVIGFLTQR